MIFLSFLLKNKKDNYNAIGLFTGFFLFYIIMNYSFIMYMEHNSADLAGHSPFYGVPFMLNLFNFDPSMYYGPGNTSVIHPLINYLSGPLSFFSHFLFSNLFFLIIQSVINALSVILIYYYLRKNGSENSLALLFAAFFGVSSYCIFTAMIPDSYPYVQFIIIVSVLYMQYSKLHGITKVMPHAFLLFCNFGATSTNMVPFIGSLFISMVDKPKEKKIKKFISILLAFLLLIVIFTLLQFVLFGGQSWISTWIKGLHDGGFRYASPFSLSQHWKAIYMLVISPILTSDIALVDSGIMAFVSDLTRPYPFHVSIIGFTVIIMAGIGFVKGIRTREVWTVAAYIFFAIFLHIIVGFGLAVFNYDLYLYAGHYLFAFFLLGASFIKQINHHLLKKGLMAIILIFVLTTLGNNVIKHQEALHVIEETYSNLKNTDSLKD